MITRRRFGFLSVLGIPIAILAETSRLFRPTYHPQPVTVLTLERTPSKRARPEGYRPSDARLDTILKQRGQTP